MHRAWQNMLPIIRKRPKPKPVCTMIDYIMAQRAQKQDKDKKKED